MNIFIIFFYKILAKYSPKRTKLHHLKKIIGGACPQTPLANTNNPTFQKKYFEPPPPSK